MSRKKSPWSGSLTLGLGWALLDARVGDNKPHRHVAHQISLALDSACEIAGTYSLRFAQGEAALIPAGTRHCLAPVGALVRTIYVDSLFRGMRDLIRNPELKRLSQQEATALEAIHCGEDARRWVGAYLNKIPFNPIDSRLHTALAEIEPGGHPAELAQVIGISTTRLREIAIRDFGVPTTKLLQWLQLQRAIEALQHSRNLADAAAAGGFADQAHFSRRLVEWFGVTPSLGLAQFEISVIR